MKAVKLATMTLAIGSLFGCVQDLPPTDNDNPSAGGNGETVYKCGTARIQKQQIIDAVNQARAKARSCGTKHFSAAAPLQWNNKLFFAADKHSKDMVANNFASHTGSNGSSVGSRVNNEGYRWRLVAENIAGGQPSLQSAVSGWLNSDGHCENIMNAKAKEFGLSCRYGANTRYGYYWTMVLASR